jgi:hypothetical protein
MAYDRYDNRDERRWSQERGRDHGRDDRGFFERAGDEISSWFGDDDDDRRRRRDDNRQTQRMEGPRNEYGPRRERERERGDYRPMAGDYSRSHHESDQFFAASGVGRGEPALGDQRGDYERSQSPWGRDEYRRTSRAGTADKSDRSRHEDPHYHAWRQRHIDDLDRDYEDYRRENQSRFENDFGSWRERRMQKRGLLGQVREHMDVVGSDDEHVGTVDKVAGDRIILTKSDPESGGAHHSLSCSHVERIEGDRVILDCSGEHARKQWRDESRSRALFEREDQGEVGPRMLDRSFPGTYRE